MGTSSQLDGLPVNIASVEDDHPAYPIKIVGPQRWRTGEDVSMSVELTNTASLPRVYEYQIWVQSETGYGGRLSEVVPAIKGHASLQAGSCLSTPIDVPWGALEPHVRWTEWVGVVVIARNVLDQGIWMDRSPWMIEPLPVEVSAYRYACIGERIPVAIHVTNPLRTVLGDVRLELSSSMHMPIEGVENREVVTLGDMAPGESVVLTRYLLPTDAYRGSFGVVVLSDRLIPSRGWSVTCVFPRCRVDMDGNGTLTAMDVDVFRSAYDASDFAADFDADAEFTIFDFLLFYQEFIAGCQ